MHGSGISLEFATKQKQSSQSCSCDAATVANDSLPKSLLSTAMLWISFSSQLSDDCLSLAAIRWVYCFHFAILRSPLPPSFAPNSSFSHFDSSSFICGGADGTFSKGLSSRSMYGLSFFACSAAHYRLDPYNRRTEGITDKTMCTLISSIAAIKSVCVCARALCVGLRQWPVST